MFYLKSTKARKGIILAIPTINSQYSNLAKGLTTLQNPNKEWGTLLIEVPADIGRAYSGYKRGGIIEGAEKFRKDMISGLIWLFGIPLFNKAGSALFEKCFKLPMNIDYDEQIIKNSLNYIAKKENARNLDISELSKYGADFAKKINDIGLEKSVKNVKNARQLITIGSWLLNCFLMGIALPKINQAITRKKLKEQQPKDYAMQFETFKEFEQKTKNKKDKNVTFKGLIDKFTYGLNNNAKVRLISTDVPMIVGRCATARNKYEAFEIALMDSSAIIFYNFTLGWTQNILSKIFASPQTNAKVSEYIVSLDENTLNNAIKGATNEKESFKLDTFFDKKAINEIYSQGTNGKFGKINRLVKDEEIKQIDRSTESLLKYIGNNKKAFKDGKINIEEATKLIKKLNIKNTAFYSLGTIISILGLGILIPKIAYAITKKITGKDGFVGIQEENKK